MPVRHFDEQIGLTQQFAEALKDRRHGGYINDSFLKTCMWIYGILADYLYLANAIHNANRKS